MKRSDSYLDFWLGFAFLAGSWANALLLEFIP
jgi:hypothetical protein